MVALDEYQVFVPEQHGFPFNSDRQKIYLATSDFSLKGNKGHREDFGESSACATNDLPVVVLLHLGSVLPSSGIGRFLSTEDDHVHTQGT